jgi:branched-chain amino acid transport system ATP-binding protein
MLFMLLQVENLESGYGKIQVLRSLSLQVDVGETIGLFGPNGHGKTTLLRTISGLIEIRGGDISFQGNSIRNLEPREIVALGLIHVPQGNTLFPQMTVQENLQLGAYNRRAWSKRAENFRKVYGLFPRLDERKSQQARTLSGGERQMLSIGVGLMGMPQLLMLDEPSLGLAPKIKEELGLAIDAIAQSGTTMLVVDQDIELLLGLCQRLYLIEKGRVSMETQEESSIQQDEILEMYFGRIQE